MGMPARQTINHAAPIACSAAKDRMAGMASVLPLARPAARQTCNCARRCRIANLDQVAALEHRLVVAGHKKVENGNDPKIIGESQQYLRDFSRFVAEESTADGNVARMVERYPSWQNLRTLWHSARSAITRRDS